jgi:hypothetical protein
VTTIANSLSSSTSSNRAIKFIQCAALLTTSVFLFRSGMAASLSNLFSSDPNSIAAVWGTLDTIVAFLLLPTSFAVLTRLWLASPAAVVLATLAFSVYAAQALLVLVDRISDQTYLLLNQYLNGSNPIFPLVISFIALTTSIWRMKAHQL